MKAAVASYAAALLLILGCGGSKEQGPETNNGYDQPNANADSVCELGGFGRCVGQDACTADVGYPSTAACGGSAPLCCAPLDRCAPAASSLVCCDLSGKQVAPVCDAAAGSDAGTPLSCPDDAVIATTGSCTQEALGCSNTGEFCNPQSANCCPGSTCVAASVPDDGGAPVPAHCQ